ncbi:MAG: DUF2237 domain-containing protein [Parvularcula sp.]|jgi:uncharacterized protein (DUF2237 family)|nr:DUF2237 domain-containing protein [Parvularcula sp.]
MGYNVFGAKLAVCGCDPMTGFLRNGYCETGLTDRGSHTVCAMMTEEFLSFTKSRGNDLTTPRPEWDFPGLKPGDRWCVCAMRWEEAREEGVAPPVFIDACHEKTLEMISLEHLKSHAVQ